MAHLLWIGGETQPQVKEFKNLKNEKYQQIVRQIKKRVQYLQCERLGTGSEAQRQISQFTSRFYPPLWSWALGSDRKNETTDKSSQNEFPRQGVWTLPGEVFRELGRCKAGGTMSLDWADVLGSHRTSGGRKLRPGKCRWSHDRTRVKRYNQLSGLVVECPPWDS